MILLVCSIRVILPGAQDFQLLLSESHELHPLSYISIQCHDLCRLLHFGCPKIKLIASFCLVELFAGITDYYTSKRQAELNVREGYLLSLPAILEGLIFFSDIRVSLNCSRCLSTLMTWEELTPEKSNWGRLIVEELVMNLSTPSLTSNLFSIHHKPAVNVTVALLRLSQVPPWMARFFDNPSVSSIIKNISPSNISTELVLLFRELLKCGYLNPAHITSLNQIFQV